MPSKVPAKISVDFTNVEDRRQATHVPEGDYLAEVADVQLKSKKDDESRRYLNWQLKLVQPTEFRGKSVFFVTSLVPESLWNLRNFLEDLGVTVPKKAVDIPLPKLIGKQLGVTLADDEYEGKIKSKVVATFSKNDYNATGDGLVSSEAAEAVVSESSNDEDMEELELDDL